MDKVENPTATRVKNSFSIENILSRPDNCENNQKRMMRQNAFQNNHVLFYDNSVNYGDKGLSSRNLVKDEEKLKTVQNHDTSSENNYSEDHEMNSDAGSDDGASSVHSEFIILKRYKIIEKAELQKNHCRNSVNENGFFIHQIHSQLQRNSNNVNCD